MSEDKKTDDEVLVDFSKTKEKIKGIFKKSKTAEHKTETPTEKHPTPQDSHLKHQPQTEKEEDLPFSVASAKEFTKRNARWLIPLLCILIAMSFSIYFRTMPQDLPITDDWAKSTVYNYYQKQLEAGINQQYPNLPQQNRNTLLQTEWQKVYTQNKQQIEAQAQKLSYDYKNQFRDDNGTLYLLGIDPYHYYRQSYYVLEYGFPGTEVRDGKIYDTYRLAPIGRETEWNFHAWVGAFLYRIVNIFTDASLMATFFYVGTIFAALTVIPAFFIGRILTGNAIGGFFTGMMIAVSSFFVARTTGESSDTDVYSVFFPVLITWLFLEALTAKQLKHKLIWMGIASFATGLFAFAWTGWWYIALFIIVTLLIYLAYLLLRHLKEIKAKTKEIFYPQLYIIGTYLVGTAVFVSLFISFDQFKRIVLGPFQFTQLKAVAVTNIWPNIKTTVAELNVPSFSHVIQQLDGKLYFVLAIVGILLLVIKKNDQGKRNFLLPFFIAMWFAASLYATTKGVRFVLQATPAYSIAVGAFLGITWHYASSWISKELKLNKKFTQITVFILLGLLLLTPINNGYSQAFHSIPSVNDAWYNALTKIKNEAPKDIIITSWWDFGHWFKAIADRPVTFDGGTQTNWDAYWVGKSLLEHNENATIGIVRMLNCGQNNAFKELDKTIQNGPETIALLNKVVLQNQLQAEKTLQQEGLSQEQAAAVIQYTHCNAPTDYYITSEDMVGKAGVWGHFGSWDFNRAMMYQQAKKLPKTDAVEYLAKTYNFTPQEADKVYAEVQTTPADQWIAPWPGYLSGLSTCDQQQNNKVLCNVGTRSGSITLQIDLTTKNATFDANGNSVIYPNSLVYADKTGIHERKFDGKTAGFSAVLIPNGQAYQILITDEPHAYSTFTKLFFFEGHGMKCFQEFDETNSFFGGKIITWVMDYNCGQDNKIFFLPTEEVNAAHILIATSGRTAEEALLLAQEIKKNVTTKNFADYAKKYSEDPGSKQQNGQLGWFSKGIMVPEFEQAAFSLKEGQISEPVKTPFGYHLILVLDKRTIDKN